VSEGDLPIGYEQVSIGGDCAADGSITLQVGDVKECTITNQEQPPTSLIAPTQTTCEMYRDGTAEEITELYYNTKKGIINSVTPGVIFFWSTIEAPGSEFTLMGDQFNDKGWTDMANLNVFLWDGSCNKVLTTTLSYE
jgi:hypothetical protein